MKRIAIKDTAGNLRERLVAETEAERRELLRRADAKAGGIDARDEDEPEDGWEDQ